MTTRNQQQGVAGIPTLFRADESIDYEAVAACVDFAARSRLAAVCLWRYAQMLNERVASLATASD